MANKVVNVTWEEVSEYLDQIVAAVGTNKVTGVYGIPRGGLVLAAWLSHRLNVPMLSAPAPGCILIDDICDSGESLLHYVRNTSEEGKDKGYWLTTMFYKENELGVKPQLYFKEKQNDWIVFPWET